MDPWEAVPEVIPELQHGIRDEQEAGTAQIPPSEENKILSDLQGGQEKCLGVKES